MVINFTKVLLITSLCFSCNQSFSQTKDSSTLALYGQFFLQKPGLRFDVEKRIGFTNHWVTAGLQYYGGQANTDGEANTFNGTNEDGDGDLMKGYGFALEHKIFLKPKTNKNFYLQYGPVYQNFTIDYSGTAWHKTEKDGQEIFSFGKINGKQQISRFGISLVAGKKLLSETNTRNRLAVDFYVGISYKKSIVKDSAPGYRDFGKNINDYAYTGLHPVYGIKLGFAFAGK